MATKKKTTEKIKIKGLRPCEIAPKINGTAVKFVFKQAGDIIEVDKEIASKLIIDKFTEEVK